MLSVGVTYAAALAVFIATAMAARRIAVSDWRDGISRLMTVALPAIFLIGPFSWEHHLILVLPSLAILLMAQRATGEWHAGVVIAGCAIAVVLAAPRWLPLKGYAVILLWLLALRVAVDTGIRLPFDRTGTEHAAR